MKIDLFVGVREIDYDRWRGSLNKAEQLFISQSKKEIIGMVLSQRTFSLR